MSTNVMGTKFAEENASKIVNLVNVMNNKLYEMLKASAQADITKAKLSLDLLGNNAVGIGDHSTEDFYKNAEEALSLLADANDRLETLEKFAQESMNEKNPVFVTHPKNK
jgi:hypothetical protein